jgi:MinD-like ATPase involved in chromosome partitioning or flagellar assembly
MTRRRLAPRGAVPPGAHHSAYAPPVVVVAGGRVGVGASTVAAGLAVAFAATRRTLLVDADEGGPSQRDLLNAPGTHTMNDLLGGTTPERALTTVSTQLTLLAGRPPALPALSSAQRSLLFHHFTTLYGKFEVVVVDAGARAATLLAACAAPTARAIVVTTGDRVAAAGAHAIEKLLHLEYPGAPVVVVGNMLDEAGAFATQSLLAGAANQFLGRDLDYVGTVPADPALTPLLGGRAPDTDAPGVLPLSAGLVALADIGERSLAAPAPSVAVHSTPLIHRSHHGTR